MKRTIILFILLFTSKLLVAQNCENVGFENGNFDGWKAYIGTTDGIDYSTEGVVLERHTIISVNEPDLFTDNKLFTFPPNGGGNYVVRLGNSNTGGEAEVLQKQILVTEFNKLFLYQYAVVLQDPGHDSLSQPMFQVKLYDANSNIVNPKECGIYRVVAGPETDDWDSAQYEVKFKKWTTVGIDLSKYINQVITIEFYVQDCSWGGHFGYAYINASCEKLKFKINSYCFQTNLLSVSGPEGFYQYNWLNTGDTTSLLITNNVNNGEMIDLMLTSETNCMTHITEKLEIKPLFTGNDVLLCQEKSFQITSNIETTNYIWSTGDTTSSIVVYSSGDYFIHSKDSACSDADTIHVEFIPFTEIGQIPNIITPNFDNTNDEFYFHSNNLANFQIKILNRWGNLIFQTDDPFNFWKGYDDEKIVNSDVYFYIINYSIGCKNENYSLDGTITVHY